MVPADVLQASDNTLALRVKNGGEVTMTHMALLFKTDLRIPSS